MGVHVSGCKYSCDETKATEQSGKTIRCVLPRWCRRSVGRIWVSGPRGPSLESPIAPKVRTNWVYVPHCPRRQCYRIFLRRDREARVFRLWEGLRSSGRVLTL